MNKKIITIINDWNPAEIYPLLEDEYYPEIKKIQEFIDKSEELSIDTLANFINSTFINAFGENIFLKNFEECKVVADNLFNTKNKK